MSKQTFTTGQVLTASQMTSLQQTAMGGGSTTAKTTSYVLVAADAGTVVQMNAAGATTITVDTALFAAGDSVQIQNIGVGVCTVTAGTATVSTAGSLALNQYEGGQLYFNTTSAALFFDIVQSASSPLTTKGDLYTYSTTDERLAIAANYAFLTADSTASTGNAWDISAWTAFSPTITAYTGTLTTATASGNYKRVGKICVARYQWLVTVNGTGATRIVLTLPFTAKTMTGNDGQVGAGREDQVTGKMCMAFQDSGSATALYVRTYDNLYPAGNLYGGQVQFIYEVA